MSTSETREIIFIDLANLDKPHAFELGRLLAETDAKVEYEFTISPDGEYQSDKETDLVNTGFRKGIDYERERILRILDNNADNGPVNWLISKIKEY
jgi:hypothetical protein